MLIPALSPRESHPGPGLVITVKGSRVILEPVDHGPDTSLGETLFVGTVGGLDCWAVDGNDQSEIDQRPDLMDLMRLFAEVDESTWAAAGRAVQLVEWSRSHRFCGHCAQPTEDSPGERARRCPACGLKAFPRLAPAIIALVERDDGRALLARNANWPTSMYSCLAGFVEPGESAEAAARREIREEVGIEIGQLRYFSSQPWPFPHSLMLGFHASYRSGDIVCDGEEIADAAWFAPDDLPGIPGRISIARRLIDDWLSRA